MGAEEYVSITVSRDTQAPSQVGFQTPMFLCYHDNYADYQRQYAATPAGLAQMVTDGFALTDPAYYMASAFISQDNHGDTFRIGRRDTIFTHDIEIEPDTGGVVPPANTVTTFTLTKGAVTEAVTRTSLGASKAAEATAIALAMNANVAGFGAAGTAELLIAGVGDVVEFDATAGNEGELWYWTNIANCLFENVTVDPGIAADLTAIDTLGTTDYYGVCLDSESDAEIAGLAAAIETRIKIFGAAVRSSEAPTAGAGDVLTTLEAANYDRTFTVPTEQDLATYPAVAWMGLRLAYNPGEVNWAFANTAARVVVDSWTANQKTIIRDTKNSNYYIDVAGFDHFFPGHVASGEWIDIIHLQDWTVARIQEAVYGVLVTSPKVPFTEKGVRSAIKAPALGVIALQQKDDDSGGFVLGSETFSSTAVADVSTANKVLRHFATASIGVRFTNAINSAGLTVNLVL